MSENKPQYQQQWLDGLWHNNPGTVQLLGLCPLLAVSNNVINALSLGLATLFVLTMSNIVLSMLRHWIAPDLRIPLFVLVIATLVTVVEQFLAAFAYPIYHSLGIFLALITTNCIIIGRIEAFASKRPWLQAAVDGVAQGLGFLVILLMMGALRELIGSGTLLAGSEQLFGELAQRWTLHIPHYQGLLMAILPPGAFILLGFIIAGKRTIEKFWSKS